MTHTPIREIFEKSQFNSVYTVHGWIRSFRKQNDLYFFNINDGTNPQGLQVICNKVDNEKLFEKLSSKSLNMGCYVKLSGELVKSPAQNQDFELLLSDIFEVGTCNPQKYPLKKNIKLESLRDLCHLRSRTKVLGCVYRIRNTLLFETHNFFQQQKFLNLDPNVVTINECEGGAGVFTITELMNKSTRDIPNKNGVINYNKDHFKRQAYLTVSSQLQLEGLACGIGNVYTMNKSFRSEHSNTNKHVSEFTHLEIEMIDVKNDDLMYIGETYIKYIIKKVYEKNIDDIEELNKFACKGLKNKFEELLNLKFYRKSYKECIEILQKEGKFNISIGDDLSSEAENFLTQYFQGAVYVYNWIYDIKSFYMKQSRNKEEPDICENFDLLMPYGIGELIGGSMRESDYDRLKSGMEKKNVCEKGLEWYLDLRRFGTVEHGGFGLGIDRLLMLVTGIQNIKDVIPYPVYFESCKF